MFSKKRRNLIFIEAAILTFIIYLIAIIFNGYLDVQRIDELDYDFANSSISLYKIQVSESFFNNIDTENCQQKKEFIFDCFSNLKGIGTDLTNYGQLFLEQNENISKLKQREYFLKELFIYKKVEEYNVLCSDEKIFPVIYFFNSLSTKFDKQALILEQFNLNHKNESIIFSFDINYENEPILELFKKQYNVTFAPFLIIQNKTTRNLNNQDLVVDLNTITIEYKNFKNDKK